MILGLEVATAVPVGGLSLSGLLAQEAPSILLIQDQGAMGNAERLRLGLDQYRRGQYEEAVATLQQVDPERLAPNDVRLLNETLASAEAAANERKAARAEFELGEEAMRQQRYVEALAHYRAAAANRFADEGTRAKAREQSAVAEAAMEREGRTLRDLYNQAVADYKAGDLAAARQKFRQLDAAGFRAPMFQRSPADYVRDIERRIGVEPPPAPPVPAPPPPVPVPRPVDEVPPPPVEPVEPMPEPPPVEPMPEPMPEPLPPVEMEPAPPPFEPEPTELEPIPEVITREEATAAYREGRQLLREGDLDGARRAFIIAQRGGYRPGLFESSPARYLAQIERQEQARAERIAREDAAAAMVDDLAATAQAERLRAEQARFEATQLVEQADTARAANRLDEALALYSRAAELDPNNARALAGRDELQRITGLQPVPEGALDRREREIRETRTFVDFAITRNLDEARAAAALGDFGEASAAIRRAQVARDTNPGVFTEAELRNYDTMIATMRTEVAQTEERWRLQEATAAQREAARLELERERLAAQEREATVRLRVREAQQLVREGRYEQALGVIDQILVLDPNNDYAIGARPLVEDRSFLRAQRTFREEFDRQMTRSLNMSEEQRIPYNDIMIYPANWPDISELRDRGVALERGEQGEDAGVIAQLDRRLPEVRMDNVAFADAIDFLRDVSGANMFVNWRALEGVGIDRSTPVSARLRDVRFSKVLRTILDDVGAGGIRLGYTIDDGVITISTEEDLAAHVATRVYDIRDLIVQIPDFNNPPQFQLQGGGQGGGGGGLFGGQVGAGADDGAVTRVELVDAIIDLIQNTVSADSWKENGGTIGSIRELQGQLIVTQTPENQRALVQLLDQLRETRAIQVTVEARFIMVQRNFLEDVGIDVDFVFNNQDPQDPNRRFSPIVVTQNSFLFNEDLSTLDTAVPGNLGLEFNARQLAPSLTTGFTYLDDFQVSLLLRATQASQYSSTLTAPRLTLFNGQRAWVAVSTETAYVSDLNPVVGVNAVAFDPTPDVIPSGVLLDVVATVSADRKYVTLTLRPTLSRLRDLAQFPVTALTAGGEGIPPIQQTAFIQQPTVDITSLNTTVSVPDGGTLLIGGQTLNGEIEREVGVPILSKIPFLKRLFTNRSVARDDQVLLILVRPTIIIQREQEQEQFPLLGTRTN